MKYIQETAFSSIVGLISGGVKEIGKIKNTIKPGTSYKSIAQRSSNYILVFPTVVSRSLSIESASMINKALERKQVQMLQILFAAHQLQVVDNPEEFLRQFHTNIEKTEFGVDDVLSAITSDKAVAEAADFILTEAQLNELARLGQRDIDYKLADSISEQGVERFYVRNDVVQEVTRSAGRRPRSYTDATTSLVYDMADPRGFTDKAYADVAGGKSVSKDMIEINKNNMSVADNIRKNQAHQFDMAYKPEKARREEEMHSAQMKNMEFNQNRTAQRDVKDDEFRNKQLNQQKDLQDREYGLKKDQNDYQRQRDAQNDLRLDQRDDFEKEKQNQRVFQDKLANTQQDIRNRMLDAEVKKENELVGSPMMVTVKVLRPGATVHEPLSFVVVVKSKLNPADSKDILDRIVNKNKDNQFFNQFIRAATSEISWGRDFLFAVDKAKLDALSNSKKSTNRLFKVLERRATYSRFKRRAGMANNAMAITTLVISQEEVELIKKEHRIDLESVSVANGILEAYNLICLVIVDETNESAKFLYDSGENRFETLSFNSLEKENKSDFKKMVTLMNKMK